MTMTQPMQFGIFSVGDITTDPTTGKTPTDASRLQDVLTIAQHAEEVGLDVFAMGEHHNPPFFPSSPVAINSWLAAKTKKIILRSEERRVGKECRARQRQ